MLHSSTGRRATLAVLLTSLVLPMTGAGAATGALTDPADDVVNAETDAPMAEPRADIVSASADYRVDSVTFGVQVAKPTDPKTDPGWAEEASGPTWAIDVSGDSEAEYLAGVFITDQAVDQPTGEVVSVNDPDKAACPATVTYSEASGYSISFAPACIDSAPSFRWGAVMVYATDPQSDEAPVGLDLVPDDETLVGPVERPAA